MKTLVCSFGILLFTSGFSQLPVSHTDSLLLPLPGKEQTLKKQAALMSLKDSTYHSYWDINTSQWRDPLRVHYSYNAAGKENGTAEADMLNGAWQDKFRQINYSFDANNNLLEYDVQLWNSGFVNVKKYKYTYDQANNLISELTQTWVAANGSWANSQYIYNSYDSDNNLLTQLFQIWVVATNSWKNNAYVVNTYDSDHNRLTSTQQQWNTGTATWENTNKETATYNTSNQYTTYVYEKWNNTTSSWENNSRNLYTYTGGDLTEQVEETYHSNTSTYTTTQKTLHFYDGNHRVSESVLLRYNASIMALENRAKYNYTYDNHDNLVANLIKRWYSNTNSWENDSRILHYYSSKTVGLHTAGTQAEHIRLYPNPATDNISILNETDIAFTNASIVDVNGKQVLTQNLDHATIVNLPLGALPQGIYILELKGENGSAYKKFIRN